MLDFDHPNVLKLLGVCFDTEDQLPVIVLPFMANGDLKSFLRKNRKQPNVKYNDFPPVRLNYSFSFYSFSSYKGLKSCEAIIYVSGHCKRNGISGEKEICSSRLSSKKLHVRIIC